MPYEDSALGVALTKIEYPDLEVPSRDTMFPVEAPRTLRSLADVKYWDLSLEETVRLALQNSNVLRDLGGAVVRAPDTTSTSMDPALQETDPRFGVEGALSNFDATLNSRLNAERIDRRTNNRFLGKLGFLQGDNDWPSVMKALDEIGYNGWGIAEQGGGDTAEGLRKLSSAMDQIFAS